VQSCGSHTWNHIGCASIVVQLLRCHINKIRPAWHWKYQTAGHCLYCEPFIITLKNLVYRCIIACVVWLWHFTDDEWIPAGRWHYCATWPCSTEFATCWSAELCGTLESHCYTPNIQCANSQFSLAYWFPHEAC